MTSRRVGDGVVGIRAELVDARRLSVYRGVRWPCLSLEDAGELGEEGVRIRMLEDIATDAQPRAAGARHGACQGKEYPWLIERASSEEDRHICCKALEELGDHG